MTNQRQLPGQAHRVLLVGGDEFRPSCIEMDRQLLALAGGANSRVAIIPTAAAFENPQRAAANGVRHFNSLGADAFAIDLTDRIGAEDPAVVDQIAGADVIYFTGGNPDHLLSVLSDSPFLDAVIAAGQRGVLLVGSSAGAMVMGERMRRPSSPQGIEALSLVPGVMVLPHHERSSTSVVSDQVSAIGESGLTVLGIDGATGALLDSQRTTVLGAGHVTAYRAGDWVIHSAGDAVAGLTLSGAGA